MQTATTLHHAESKDAARQPTKAEMRAATLKNAILKARKAPCQVKPHPTEPRTYLITTPEGHEYKTWFRDNDFGTRDGYCNCQTDHSKYACYVLVIGSIADSYETSYPPVDALLFAEYVLRVKADSFFSDEEWMRVRMMVSAPTVAYQRYGRREAGNRAAAKCAEIGASA